MQSAETILIVEDNDDDIFAIKRALKKAKIGNPQQIVKDGREAVNYLSGFGMYADRLRFPLPCLIFLDLKLPLMDGFEVLGWLGERGEFQAIPVVVLTGSDEVKDCQRAYACGARSYLVKPPTSTDLLTLIKSLESYWLLSRDRSPFEAAKA